MMPPEESHSDSAQQPSRSMVDRRHFAAGAVTDSTVANNGTPTDWIAQQSQTPEILNNPLDPLWMIHSFRRRWVLATGMGVLIATILSGLAYWLTPNETTAQALIEVKSKRPAVVFDLEQSDAIGDYERYQQTQIQKIKSHFVLTAALRDCSLLPAIRVENNKIAWLIDRFNIGFAGGSEILRITMVGDEPADELLGYVEAVTDAYMKVVVDQDRQNKFKILDGLKAAKRKVDREISMKTQSYIDQAATLKAAGDEGVSVEREILIKELSAVHYLMAGVTDAMFELEMTYQMYKQAIKDPSYFDRKDQERMEGDSYLAALTEQANYDQYQLAQQRIKGTSGKSRSIKKLMETIGSTQQLIAEYRNMMKQRFQEERESGLNELLRKLRKEYEMKKEFYGNELAKNQEEADNLMVEATALGTRDAELEMLKADIDELRAVLAEMGTTIRESEIENDAPDRITLVQQPITFSNLETYQRYIIVVMAWLFGFALTCFGIAYLEYQAKRLNGPEQVDEGLGIRVVGALPSLAFRGETDDSDPLLAFLMESIDNVRTTLMHDSTSHNHRVIMVTSATGHEGRTTVASQLAASLARAGRRTLLVDGDLRHPSLHTLFDVPLDDGLCEVLRAETEVDDVVRPTHAEGLWLLTAGYCDVPAIQAMAKGQLQPIIEKLRNQYDFVIIDAAPALNLSDALIMGQYVDGVIVSVLRDVTKIPQLHQVHELLKSLNIPVFGSVVNGVRVQADIRTERLHLIAPPQVAAEATADMSTEA